MECQWYIAITEDYSTGRRRHQSGTPLNLRKTSNFSTKTSGKSAMPTFVHVFRVSLWHATNFIRRWSELCRIESRARPKSSSFLFSPLLRYRAQRRESITFRRSCTSADRSALTCKCASKGGGGRGGEKESEWDIGSFLHPSRYRPPIITTQHR